MKTTLTLLLAALISQAQAALAAGEGNVKQLRGAITTPDRQHDEDAGERAEAAPLVGKTSGEVETKCDIISQEERAQDLEKELTAAQQVADEANAQYGRRRAQDERTIAELQAELAKSKSNETLAHTASDSKTETALQADLEKACAEIARLNELNLEQQAQLDELREERLSKPGASPRGNAQGAVAVPDSDATRARRAALVVTGAFSRLLVSYSDQLARALSRRDRIAQEVAKLAASPADGEAPGRLSELQAELSIIDENIARLAALLGHGPRREE